MTLDACRAWAERHLPWARRAVVVVLALGLGAFVLRGADGPADPSLSGASARASRQSVAGFGQIVVRVTTAEGRSLDWCAMLAATAQARQQGLMGRRSLGGYDAMVFRFDAPTTAEFYMFRTVMPLSIAWFDAGGQYVSATDMDPCPAADPGGCATFGASGPYLHAVEVKRGRLAALGMTPGSRLSFPGGSCT